MTEFDGGRALQEPLAPGLSQLWELDDIRYEGDTAYQHVVIAKTAQGVSLFCDDDPQSNEFSHILYHEALLVPALLLAERVDRVLAVGSSEGVISKLALNAGASLVDHVDIDTEAVRLCAEHLPYGYTPAELAGVEANAETGDGPVRMYYADGWDFVRRAAESTTDKYDIIIVDLPGERDDDAQHNRLFGTDFLTLCASALAEGGVVGSQVGCPNLWQNATLLRSWQRFNDAFDTVAHYGSDEFNWSFLFGRADKVADPTARMIERLATCEYRPVSIDSDALVAGGIPPYSVRHARR
ncbi:MAG: spermidine synthase [Pseudonocardiaceae bacterium]|nr:spermidine synthase [Pseudonocardiaceae bacterium]